MSSRDNWQNNFYITHKLGNQEQQQENNNRETDPPYECGYEDYKQEQIRQYYDSLDPRELETINREVEKSMESGPAWRSRESCLHGILFNRIRSKFLSYEEFVNPKIT